MPIEIDSQTYYRTAEVCTKIGISRATLFRWLKAGLLKRSVETEEVGDYLLRVI